MQAAPGSASKQAGGLHDRAQHRAPDKLARPRRRARIAGRHCARQPRARLGGAAARDGQLLHVLGGGVQVHAVLGARLPPLVLRLQVLACGGAGAGRGAGEREGRGGRRASSVLPAATGGGGPTRAAAATTAGAPRGTQAQARSTRPGLPRETPSGRTDGVQRLGCLHGQRVHPALEPRAGADLDDVGRVHACRGGGWAGRRGAHRGGRVRARRGAPRPGSMRTQRGGVQSPEQPGAHRC